jgi:transcriptional regulator with XRE-family HTH domain
VNNVRDEKYLREFGKNLRQLRLKKDVTQEVLSEDAGIGKNQVGLIERGEVNVTISTIKRLAKNLGVQPKDLLDF